LSKEKNRRNEIGKANYGLNNRNESVNTRNLYRRERDDYSERNRQENNYAERSSALLRARRNARD
jgi:hypothetical protein